MCAEELTNQVLYMRNIPAGEKDVWMTFEAIEEGELGKNQIHIHSNSITSVTSELQLNLSAESTVFFFVLFFLELCVIQCHLCRATSSPQREGSGTSPTVV